MSNIIILTESFLKQNHNVLNSERYFIRYISLKFFYIKIIKKIEVIRRMILNIIRSVICDGSARDKFKLKETWISRKLPNKIKFPSCLSYRFSSILSRAREYFLENYNKLQIPSVIRKFISNLCI